MICCSICAERLVLLQHLARDVERQILGVDHAAQEPQIRRSELVAVFDDENALGVEPQAAPLFVEQIERGLLGHIEQRVKLHRRVDRSSARARAASASSKPVMRRKNSVCCSSVTCDFGLRPDRRRAVDLLVVEVDRELHEVRVLLDDSLTRHALAYSRSSSFRCRTISVPGCSRSPGSTVNVPASGRAPDHRLGAGCIDRVRTSTREATMKAA